MHNGVLAKEEEDDRERRIKSVEQERVARLHQVSSVFNPFLKSILITEKQKPVRIDRLQSFAFVIFPSRSSMAKRRRKT